MKAEGNPYRESDPEAFDAFSEIVTAHPRTYGRILKARRKDLLEWADRVLPMLKGRFFGLGTKAFWILNGLTRFPKCGKCGRDMDDRNVKATIGYPAYCCNRCQVTSPEFAEKRAATWERKYGRGIRSPSQVPAVREKQKAACAKRFGTPNPMQAEEVRRRGEDTKAARYGDPHFSNAEKAAETRRVKNGGKWESEESAGKRRRTCLERYGTENPNQADAVRKKARETAMRKYGTESANSLPEVKEKKRRAFEMCYGKGITNYSQTAEFKAKFEDEAYVKAVQGKRAETMRKNGTFFSSRQEDLVFEALKSVYPDLMRQYGDIRYPFSCDFYSPSSDLFIEYNGTWTHGGHEYDETNLDDVRKADLWKLKAETSRFYANALQTWTARDKAKFEAARKNSLNYMVFWNIDEVKAFLGNGK